MGFRQILTFRRPTSAGRRNKADKGNDSIAKVGLGSGSRTARSGAAATRRKRIQRITIGREIKTLQEYMDPGRFPQTTQPGLSPKGQLFIDAQNYDGLIELQESGGTLDAEQQAILRELEAKRLHRKQVYQELNSQTS